MSNSLRLPGQILPLTSQAVVSDGMVLRVGSADNTVRLPGGASPATALFGVVMRPDGSSCAAGDIIDVVVSGIYPLIAAGTITRGDMLTSGGTDGTVITQAAAGGANVGIIGQALESAVSGDRVAALINPSIMQGA